MHLDARLSFLRRLVERVEVMKRCRLGNGETECVLCGEVFRFYTRGQRRCTECGKMTWQARGAQSTFPLPTSAETIPIPKES